MNAVLDAFRQAQFSMTDFLRQAQGDAVGAFGLDPTESPYRIVASGTHWCLRDYGGEHGSRSLLIIAAPIKRPYIWDLAPSCRWLSESAQIWRHDVKLYQCCYAGVTQAGL